MKTIEFLQALEQHQNKSLLFEYTPGNFVKANYHVTEVKNIIVDAIDCGANGDYWKETVIQLWESPAEIGKTEYMTADKALAILNKVDQIKPMTREAEVKIEYSNESFHTAHLFINDLEIQDTRLIVKLAVEKTDCKAKETCGVPVEETVSENSCTPGGGCC